MSRRAKWILASTVAVVLVATGALLGLVAGLLAVGERSLERVQVDGIEAPGEHLGDADVELDEIDDVLHVLVVGSDRREGLSEEARRELGTGDADGDRTDTIMLVRMDPSTDEAAILSFPRDLLVTRCDGSRGRINAAYQVGERTGIGGASCLVQTITEKSDLSIHHFVEVDFAGFIDLVEIVEGVTVYLEEPLNDPLAHIDLEAGCQRLTGVDALGFVRHRASDSDYGRIARQQRFIKELTREATSIGSLLNIPRMYQMVESAAGSVTTDQVLTLDKMRRIAFTLRDLEAENMVARTVPADHQRIDGADYEIPREEEAWRLYRAFEAGRLGDSPPDEDEEDDGAPQDGELAVGDVPPVRVVNATQTSGLAGAFSRQLAELGFQVDGLGNMEPSPAQTALVRHPPDLVSEAEYLAGYVPGAELEQGEDYLTIELVLGDGADPTHVGRERGGEASTNGGGASAGTVDPEPDALEEPGEADGPGDPGEAPAPPPGGDRQFVGAQEPPEHCR